MNNIYVSTMAFMGRNVNDVIALAKENGFNLEFSSGLPYDDAMEAIYLSASVKRLPHNYFPAPADPFVLNLASKDETIRNRSLDLCKKGLELAAASSSPFFSAHAGFCIDPQPSQLGKAFSTETVYDKSEHWAIFINSVNEILVHAEKYNIDFLIENNVIGQYNFKNDSNPLFCCESKDVINLFNTINNKRLGLLLDTGHLKVSCKTLGLDIETEMGNITPYIRCVHHSDNDGFADSNEPIDNNYWFLPHIKTFSNCVHVIETKNESISGIEKQVNLLIQTL